MTDAVQISSQDEEFKLNSKLGYDVMYNLYMADPGVLERDFPTYEEYIKAIEKATLHETLGFVKPGGSMAAAAIGATKLGADILKDMGSNINAESFLGSAQKIARARAERFARQTANAASGSARRYFSNEDEGDGGTSKANYSGGSKWNPTGLSTNLKPMDTSFDTDIAFTGISKYQLDGRDENAPLIIKYGCPGLMDPKSGDNQDERLYELFKEAICAEWRREISKRVVVNSKVEEAFTEEQINNMFNSYLQALAIYYFWQSVIAYTDETRNRNGGMLYLRGTLTAEEYNDLYTLRRLIDSSVIPPFAHKFMHYMMGNYKQSHVPGSPLIKIMPFVFKDATQAFTEVGLITLPDGTTVRPVRFAINLLSDDSMRRMQDIMARAFSDWCYGDVMDYTSEPRVDPDYNTFWVNGQYTATHEVGGAPVVTTVPQTSDFGDVFTYNLHTDAPDGWVQAMQAVFDVGSGANGIGFFKNQGWFNTGVPASPGIMGRSTTKYSTMIGSAQTSCVIYCRTGAILEGFHPIEVAQYYQHLSGNTFNVFSSSSAVKSFQRYGTERIINMDVLNIRQSCYEFANLLYTSDLRSTALPGKIQQGGKVMRNSNNKRGKYGKKSKGKDDASMKDEI